MIVAKNQRNSSEYTGCLSTKSPSPMRFRDPDQGDSAGKSNRCWLKKTTIRTNKEGIPADPWVDLVSNWVV